MKLIKISLSVKIPEGIKINSVRRVVHVKGPRGALKRDFSHLTVDIKVLPKSLEVTKYFGSRKQIASVRTVCSHIENMIKGVMYGYRYKMKSVYAHFPVNMVVGPNGKSLEIRNFQGEKVNRLLAMEDGVTVAQTGVKDEIQVDGNDLEKVAKAAAQIHQSCKIRKKDIRKFLDGIYVSEKGAIEAEA